MAEKEKISIVFPVWNEETNLASLHQKVREACGKAGVNYEMIFVDDGSNDNSLEIIKGLRSKDAGVKYVSFSRNFGHQISFFAGLTYGDRKSVV